ncbi:MAG: desulfoferrodoxin [Dehalococcoidia bacterium]|nr:desulfoferrodoxin [Dehalococcoidia bacterium]
MENKLKFFVCKHCGNIALLVNDSGAPLVCCGEHMAEMQPNTTEASVEKHLPVVSLSESTISVKIGSVAHPMDSEHHIAFLYVETEFGGQRKYLKVGEEPSVEFCFTNDKPIAVYAYCNKHGLWKIALS